MSSLETCLHAFLWHWWARVLFYFSEDQWEFLELLWRPRKLWLPGYSSWEPLAFQPGTMASGASRGAYHENIWVTDCYQDLALATPGKHTSLPDKYWMVIEWLLQTSLTILQFGVWLRSLEQHRLARTYKCHMEKDVRPHNSPCMCTYMNCTWDENIHENAVQKKHTERPESPTTWALFRRDHNHGPCPLWQSEWKCADKPHPYTNELCSSTFPGNNICLQRQTNLPMMWNVNFASEYTKAVTFITAFQLAIYSREPQGQDSAPWSNLFSLCYNWAVPAS